MRRTCDISCVGADAHIGPKKWFEFAGNFRKIAVFCRADVGIGPYNAGRKKCGKNIGPYDAERRYEAWVV